MSENLDLVRSIYADRGRGDFSSVAWAHPVIEYVQADGPAPGRWSGLPGLAYGARELMNAWDEGHIEADEYRALDAERVLVLDRGTGRGKRSGLEVGQLRTHGATVFYVRDGKVTRLVAYWDRDSALADLGLER
jgi:ketosteroid isomerase-like protein